MVYNVDYFNKLITNSNLYFAHLSNGKKSELLSEHSALVYDYAKLIVDKQQLNSIILNLIDNAIPKHLSNKQLLAECIEKLFWQAIVFHDLGKVNDRFQRNRMKNNADLLSVSHTFENQHSIISVYLFLADYFLHFLQMELNEEEQIFLCNVALYLSYPIYKHHSSTIEKAQDDDNWSNEDLFKLKPYLSLFNSCLNDEQVELFHNCFLNNANFNFFFDRFNNNVFEDSNAFPLYALVKMNYSLLTASDYLATAHYMNDWKEMLADFGTINDTLRTKIVDNAKKLKPYNKETFNAIKNGESIAPDSYTEQSNYNLNCLRKFLVMEVVQNIRENIDKNLFYIEAPTGGGKTNISMLAMTELLNVDNTIKKVFYVFPFTTLITQTYKSLKDTLGLENDEISEIHSKASLQNKSKGGDKNEESDYLNYLDNLFMNYPISLLSHIRFFDVLKTNHKETNYLLHRFANSIVIIDEIQSYSPKIWDKIIYFIANYAKYFNMKFIIMSATLPKIGEIIDRKELASNFVYLINDKNKYFLNPNFCNRVQFDYSLLDWEIPKKDDMPEYFARLKDIVIEKSQEYCSFNSKYPQTVFCIIEFIFKKTANDFYSLILSDNDFFNEIFLLSGTILEPRRKQIIKYLKSEEARKKKILLISTQVVEAGVDIDMDLGFKDKSIIDNEEQLAGRINRNVNKSNCILYLFDCNTEKTLYGGDDRYRLMRNDFSREEYKLFLETKDFDTLYSSIIEKIKKKNKSQFIENIDDLYSNMAQLNFCEVDKSLKIINQQNVSVFVPLSIDIKLLEDFRQAIDSFKIPIQNDEISGEDVWMCYESLTKNQNEDFVKNKVEMKKLQGLMSAFVFSIFPNGKDHELLRTYGEEKYGFLYLENHHDIYSFENGINTTLLENSNFI